jgi:hypothetical protein
MKLELGTDEKRCGQCVHFLTHKPSKAINTENRNYGGWCSKLQTTTCPELLRCGGDDFERLQNPFEPKRT